VFFLFPFLEGNLFSFLIATSIATAALVDKPKKFPQVSNQSYGITGLAIFNETNKINLGLQYNWDYAFKRFDYSYNLDYYQTFSQDSDQWTDGLHYSAQHKMSYLFTRHVNLFAQYQYESNDFQGYTENYAPGIGIGYTVFRKPQTQWNLFAGSLVDILAITEVDSVGGEHTAMYHTPKMMIGNTGYWMGSGKNVAVQWDNWLTASLVNEDDFTVITKVDTDIHLRNNLYFRTHYKQTNHSLAKDSEERLTFGLVWNNWSTVPSYQSDCQ
jgi:hypothetical protein